ncbi:helix-turn-helix domain-containing protein [Enterococcus casseliflavus]|uniref:GH39 family glycosyl hydrolase n=1 Tax=Enterococcus casseliflavus TaxID=37734 RepID=UPI0039A4AE8B
MQLVNPWENIKIEKVKNDELYFFDNNIHIIFVLIGDASLSYDQQYLVLQKDDFMIIPKAQKYLLTAKNAEVFHITLTYEIAMNNKDLDIEYIFQGNSVETSNTSDYEVVKFINRLLQLYVFKEYNQNAFVFQNYFGLIGVLEKYYRKKIILDRKKSAIKKIEELKFYIDNNFDKDITLSEIANNLFLSEQYLSRLFSKEMGISISEYTIQKRLEKVRNELLNTEKSVIDIAFGAGFSNINSFNRIFKKYQGLTPSEYRKEVKQGVVITTIPEITDDSNFEELKELLISKDETKLYEVDEIKIFTDAEYPSYNPELLINLGYAEDLLDFKLAQQIKLSKKQINFKYGRIWGLLSPNLVGNYQEELDFSKTDFIIDSILESDLIPFLEIGFKGKTIYGDYNYLIENQPFSKDVIHLKNYLDMLQKFLKHCITRYGYQTVAQWQLELWKPQRIVIQTIDAINLGEVEVDGRKLKLFENKNYFYFFGQVSQTVKNIVPEMAVGGCGISVDIKKDSVGELLKLWQADQIQPDFFSVGIFPMDEIKSDFTSEKRSNPISPDVYFMARHVQAVKKSLDQLNMQIPLYITEFNVTILNRNLINDTAYKGNYIVKNIIEAIPYCQLVGYWLYSDAAVVSQDTKGQEVFGGSGLVSRSGIPKTGFYGLSFLGKMTGRTIHYSEGLLVTMPDPYTINILAINYAHLNSAYYYNSQGSFRKENIYTIFNNKFPRHLRLDIQLPVNFTGVVARMKTESIAPDRGSHLEEIIKLNIDSLLNQDEITYLDRRCIPQMRIEDELVNNHLIIDFEVETHEIIFETISLLK